METRPHFGSIKRADMSDGEQNKKRKLEEIADAGDAAPAPPQETGAAEEQDAPATHSNSSSTVSSSSPVHDEHGQLAKEKESIMKLLEPFSREQLVEILTSAASQYDNIYNEIKTVASADVAHRKVFVRGLAWETSTETLKSAFASFGEVEEGAVIFDKASGKSRGYGFVTFVDMEAAQRAVEKQVVEIDGRRATCNLAALRPHSDDHQQSSQQHQPQHQKLRPVQPPPPTGHSHTVYTTTPLVNPMYPMQMQPAHQQQQQHTPTGSNDESDRKLFVRGLSWDTSNDALRAEFQKYGELEEAMIARDRRTGKSKGFGFVTYKHRAGAERALQQPQKQIDGRTTSCNLASQGSGKGGSDRNGGGMSYAPAGMAPAMPAPVPTYAVPMYTAVPGPYGTVPAPPPMVQQPVQYSAYPTMPDPYRQQQQPYGAMPPAPQYYQNRPPPPHQPPQRK